MSSLLTKINDKNRYFVMYGLTECFQMFSQVGCLLLVNYHVKAEDFFQQGKNISSKYFAVHWLMQILDFHGLKLRRCCIPNVLCSIKNLSFRRVRLVQLNIFTFKKFTQTISFSSPSLRQFFFSSLKLLFSISFWLEFFEFKYPWASQRSK